MFLLQGRSYSSSCWWNFGVYTTLELAKNARDGMHRTADSHSVRIVKWKVDFQPGMDNYEEIK